jgi:hypothetical protein
MVKSLYCDYGEGHHAAKDQKTLGLNPVVIYVPISCLFLMLLIVAVTYFWDVPMG